jgi:zinc/manganese transport system permease protein
MDAWIILLPAFTLSLLVIFTHTYLGLHVLERGIIFVDLALAQVAALGISVAFLLGEEAHGTRAQLYAFAATLLAAFALAGLRRIKGKTNREVIIGCIYVVATALSIVILSRSSQGMEEMKSMFNGNILWVRWDEIGLIAAIYAALGLLHTIYRKQFLGLSFTGKGQGKDQGQGQGLGEAATSARPGFIWEFLFFSSFAVTITLAVNVVGVLLVFAFLIIPAFSASILTPLLGGRLLLGWLFGALGSAAGLWLAFAADLPVGATVVSVMGLLPLLAVTVKFARG